MKKSDFNYQLPAHLIAQQPLKNRSASRLLIVKGDSKTCRDDMFRHFIDYLDQDDLLIFNDTKVIPARLFGKKQTGGKLEFLIERILPDSEALTHIKASKSPKPETIIELDGGYQCLVIGRENDLFKIRFLSPLDPQQILQEIGHIPLPPYINRQDTENDIERYQTVFAQNNGAVAAPTAGLHFDEAVMQRLQEKGISKAFVTLHVGSGTFQPVRVDNLQEHQMHFEYFSVSEETANAIKATKKKGGRIFAIGTTAVRALEAASTGDEIKACYGDTNLFITPGYRFKTVDAMLTNFHLPESTLLMLVSAFAGYETIMRAYHHAIEQSYRFFSYGDAMLLFSEHEAN